MLMTNVTESAGMDASAWVAVVAAAIAVVAVGVAIWQAVSARSQARSAKEQAEHAQVQSDSAKRQADAAVQQTEIQERIRRDRGQPYVWADFRLDATQGSLMLLVIRNEGPTVAEDVRIVFEPPLQSVGLPKSLEPVHAQLAEGLRAMPPGREMRWGFAMGHRLYGDEGSEVPHRYTVTITGRGPYGDLPTLTYPLDLDEMREMAAPRLGTLDHVAKAIEKLAKQQP
jgi:hypothetical protein